MVSCQMFMLALHTIWRFCLSKTCGVREYLSGLRAEIPCVPPSSKGNAGGFLFVYTWAQGVRQFPCNPEPHLLVRQ